MKVWLFRLCYLLKISASQFHKTTVHYRTDPVIPMPGMALSWLSKLCPIDLECGTCRFWEINWQNFMGCKFHNALTTENWTVLFWKIPMHSSCECRLPWVVYLQDCALNRRWNVQPCAITQTAETLNFCSAVRIILVVLKLSWPDDQLSNLKFPDWKYY